MEGGPQLEQTPDQAPQDYWPENDDPKLEPRIYVADLLAYNWGELRGVWLNAAQEPEALQEQIDAMLAGCKYGKAEEWAIHDFEGFNGLHLGEWEDLAHVSKVATGIEQHGEPFAHWATLVSEDDELDQFEQQYVGRWPSRTDYAADVLDDLGLYDQVEQAVPENLKPYVTLDAEGFGRDLELGGDITVIESNGRVYVFSNR